MEWNEMSNDGKERITNVVADPLNTTVTLSAGMTTSHSQPIYVPGKYSVCLRDILDVSKVIFEKLI